MRAIVTLGSTVLLGLFCLALFHQVPAADRFESVSSGGLPTWTARASDGDRAAEPSGERNSPGLIAPQSFRYVAVLSVKSLPPAGVVGHRCGCRARPHETSAGACNF